MNYRLVEQYPEDGKRHEKTVRNTVFKGPDKDQLKKAFKEWCATQRDFSKENTQRKPYAEPFMYYGTKRIYAYEL